MKTSDLGLTHEEREALMRSLMRTRAKPRATSNKPGAAPKGKRRYPPQRAPWRAKG